MIFLLLLLSSNRIYHQVRLSAMI